MNVFCEKEEKNPNIQIYLRMSNLETRFLFYIMIVHVYLYKDIFADQCTIYHDF